MEAEAKSMRGPNAFSIKKRQLGEMGGKKRLAEEKEGIGDHFVH